MKPIQIVVVDNKKVSCDGSESKSSHPLVYLTMGEKDNVECPYCGCNFTIKKSN